LPVWLWTQFSCVGNQMHDFCICVMVCCSGETRLVMHIPSSSSVGKRYDHFYLYFHFYYYMLWFKVGAPAGEWNFASRH